MQLSTSVTLYHYCFKIHAHKLFTIRCNLNVFMILDFIGIEMEN